MERETALRTVRSLLQDARRLGEGDEVQQAGLFEAIGNTYRACGELEEARKWFGQALALWKKATSEPLTQKAPLYWALGDLVAGEGECQRVVELNVKRASLPGANPARNVA